MKTRRHKGTSLVETLVIIVIGGVIATLAIKVLHQSQVNARQAQAWLDLQRGATRLETQLRQDLRDATEVTLPDEKTLVIQQADSSISYTHQTGLVERSLKPAGSEQVQHEGFRLPSARVDIALSEPEQVRVVIEANQGLPSSEQYVIEQTIGRQP
ncbi:hypothetical protein AB1K70_13045 [Bremerella sp. JC770]|uniref:PulJ/GspJ family protein n=1 Tax=Bremerella sp. JC770 TaxID=3232137 RepID=UPI0034592301